MEITEQLNNDLKNSMKAGDKGRTETLRMLKSAIKYAEIDVGHPLNEQEVLGVITKQAKQRRDSIAEFEKAGRTDLVEHEAAELVILEQYLPAQLSEEEVKAVVQTIITNLGVTDAKEMGQVMKHAMAELKGKADGKIVNQVVRQLLSR